MGQKDTPYGGGIFFIRVRFPDNYPDKRPEVVFKTPIYHLNINPIKSEYKSLEPLGYVGISSLEDWKPDYAIRQVLCDIYALLYMPNPDQPYGHDRAGEFIYDKELYDEKVRYFTKKYATYQMANKEYNESWDFSFP